MTLTVKNMILKLKIMMKWTDGIFSMYIEKIARKQLMFYLKEICNAAENGNSILLKSLIEDNRPLKEVVKEIDSGREDVTNFFNKIYLKIQSKH